MDQTVTSTALEQYAAYPFDSDETYQSGLAGILDNSNQQSLEGQEDVLLKSRVFYFQRITGHELDMAEVEAYERSKKTAESMTASISPPSTAGPLQESSEIDLNTTESRTLTFSELKELLEQGKTDGIPNNKEIPDLLNDASPSQSQAIPRKKPWEKVTEAKP